MTVDNEPVPASAEVQEEMAAYFGALDFRADRPTGTVLAEGEYYGGSGRVQITQGDSMVRHNGRSLPGRTVVYDTRTGVESRVPTAQLSYQLSKRRQGDGSRVYSLTRPTDIPVPVPIEDTCLICLRSRNGVPRLFYSETNLIDHYQLMHTREWTAMEKEREIRQSKEDAASRREEAGRMERLILALITAVKPDAVNNLPADLKAQLTDLQSSLAAGKKK